MRIEIDEFVEAVRAMSGLAASEGGEVGWAESEKKRFDRTIAQIGIEEATAMLLDLPIGALEPTEDECEVKWEENLEKEYVGTYTLPGKCLRVVGVRCGEGALICVPILEPNRPGYWQRLSIFREISGTPDMPRLYLLPGRHVNHLELHCVERPDTGWVSYVPIPEWKEGKLEVAGAVGRLLVSRTSARVRELLSN